MYQIKSIEEYHQATERAERDPEGFWAEVAEHFRWQKKWDRVLRWEFQSPEVRWFEGGVLNITESCLDRHLAHRADELALVFEPNDPREQGKTLSYRHLYQSVCRMANVLHKHGVRKGDRVALYMPMIPELAIATLACARIGAVHSVVFAGFSAQALADRILDAQAVMVITADGLFRGAKEIPLKSVVDEALAQCPGVRTVLVGQRTGWAVDMQPGRDFWLQTETDQAEDFCPAEPMQAEDPLFILYTSGSTGKPKGVLHTCGGYMVYAGYTFANVFQVRLGDIFWCTADIGWVTGHSYILYGPLLNGVTTVMFEGVPTYPDASRFWEVVEKHRVTQFYTAPTAIRALMAAGDSHVLPYVMKTLRVIGSVGEPINEEAWHWYHTHVGKGRCPVVDTWWQTETGGIMISGLGSISPMRAAHAGLPLPGIRPVLLDNEGIEIRENEREGLLCISFPWPGMLRTIWGDHERCRTTYFAPFAGYYFTGDGARRDENGLFRIIGRVDDVINVSGHRLGTAEVENAINACPIVAESAVVGYAHDIKGQGIHAYVILSAPTDSEEDLRGQIRETVAAQIGRIALPDRIQFVRGLPKTRSGKIMRRILRKIAEGDVWNLGDVSTLLDPEVVEEIRAGAEGSEY